MKKAVVILSGGMDSTTLLYDISNQGYDIEAISFNYNQKHQKELICATATCKKLGIKHKIIDLRILGQLAPSALTREDVKIPEGSYTDNSMKLTVVPNRNMVMLSLAASYALGSGITDIFYGAHAGDHAIYPDCRIEFVEAMKKVFKLCDWKKINLNAPYLKIDKAEIARIGKKLNVDYGVTWTCYKGGKKACGKCGSCTERLEAFAKAGMKDPVQYE